MSEHCYCRPGTDYCLHISSITSQRVKRPKRLLGTLQGFQKHLVTLFRFPLLLGISFFFQLYLEFKDQVHLLKSSCRYWIPSQGVQNLKSHFKLAPISSLGHPKKSLIRSAWTLSALFCSVFQTSGLTDLCWEAKSKAFVCFMLVLGPAWNNYFHCFCNISVL